MLVEYCSSPIKLLQGMTASVLSRRGAQEGRNKAESSALTMWVLLATADRMRKGELCAGCLCAFSDNSLFL